MPDAIALTLNGIEAFKLYTHGEQDHIISQRLARDGIWEAYETQLTLDLLKEGDVYIDAGANIGYYSLIASRKVGAQGQVFCYEPDTQNFVLLEKNIQENQCHNVRCFALALSDQKQAGKIYLSPDNFGDHRIYDDANRPSYAIELVNGSEHLSQYSQRINFLKVDTQGAEYFVIKGLMPLLKANRQQLNMIIEISPFGIRHSGAHGLDLLALLDELAMHYYYIDHIHHRLEAKTSNDLAQWIKSLDDYPDNEGFINLLVTAEAKLAG